MSVEYASSESLPYLGSVFICRCGQHATRHGRHAGEPPPGWVLVEEQNGLEPLCPNCAPASTVQATR